MKLIKRLVYTNVAMMDDYLPEIQAVVAGQDPEEALRSIESPETTTSHETMQPENSLK